MKIETIISQHRRDFQALYKCDHCGHTVKGTGYDDDHFHRNVIPSMSCPSCGMTAGDDYRPLQPKYPADAII